MFLNKSSGHGAPLGQGAAQNMTMQLRLLNKLLLKRIEDWHIFTYFKDDDQYVL